MNNLDTLHLWPITYPLHDHFRPEMAQVTINSVDLFTDEEWALVWECEAASAEGEAYGRRN